MAIFGTSGKDTIIANGSSLNFNGALSTSASANSVYGGKGNDTLIISNQSSIVDAHGEKGNDIILVSSLNNGAIDGTTTSYYPNPFSCLPGSSFLASQATSQFISGGVGSDIMSAIHPSSLSGSCSSSLTHQTNVFLGDSRLFANPTTGLLATNASSSKGHGDDKCGCGDDDDNDKNHASGKGNVFLEGGHDIVHGSQVAGDNNVLELRGQGWEIRLSDGTLIDASNAATYINQTTGKITIPDGISGVAMANLTGSSNKSENGLHTISFDHINTIQFTDGGLGGSNTINGLANSTQNVAAPTAYAAGGSGATAIVSSSGDVIFGANTNNNIAGTSKDDVIYAGDGSKVVNSGAGSDTLFAGNGNQTFNLGSGHDVISFGSNVHTANTQSYAIHGGSGDNWIDLSGLGSAIVKIHLSNGSPDLTVDTTQIQNVMNIASGVTGTITSGNTTINFDHISKVIY